MTTLTIITDTTIEQGTSGGAKVFDAFKPEQCLSFANEANLIKDGQTEDSWLLEFSKNSLYIITVNGHGKILGVVTAINSKELLTSEEGGRNPLVLTGFASNPRDTEQESAMLELLIEAAVIVGYKTLTIPMDYEFTNAVSDRIATDPAYKAIKTLNAQHEYANLYCLKDYKTYAMLELKQG